MSADGHRTAEELTRRLAEAEATINALLAGQIDAVIQPGNQTPLLLAEAQDSLRLERDRAQQYLDAPEVILLARDLEGRITLINRYACSILGWTRAELIGRDWIDTCLPARLHIPMRQRFHALLAGDVTVLEISIITKTGEERLIEWRNTLLRDDAGALTGALSSGNDITERRAVELALQQTTADLRNHTAALDKSEERTAYALNAAGMGVWELDMETKRVTWLATLAPVFGVTAEQAPTDMASFFQMVHFEDRAMVEASFNRATEARVDFKEEFRVVWPDGSAHWIASQARALPHPDGKPGLWMGISMDISERKVLEAQFRQAQKMEAVGQLAGGVAHDFNNLLTSILGYSAFVIETFTPHDPRRSDLEQVVKAGQRAAGLTRQLLAFSRKQVLQPTRLELNQLVVGMQQMLSRLIGEDVELVTNLASDLGAVRADPGQFEQVLMNLVVNARDAMPSGGRLQVQTANVEIDDSFVHEAAIRPGSYVMLAVSDTGTGMTEATKSRLFEPFFTTKSPGKGTGLGLATVYGIVKQSGGYVWVYSELGKGTSFKVYLPYAADDGDVAPRVAPESAPRTGTEAVLVVEDENAVRLLTRRILEEASYRVFDAPNPRQAEAVFDQHPGGFDLLLTDVIMPGSSGPNLFEKLVRRQPTLKVLYLSGYTDTAITGELKPGVNILLKPFSANVLKRKIREVLDEASPTPR